MKKKRRDFEKELFDRLQSIEEALALLTQSLSQPTQPVMPHIWTNGYTCVCGAWVAFGQTHYCVSYQSPLPFGQNTCEATANDKPNLKVVN